MKQKTSILWITRTAVFIALLIVFQVAAGSFGNVIITGSVVNLLLIVSVMTSGPSSGITVAVISPAVARFLGIGPLWSLIPFIAAGNVTLVSVWHLIGRKHMKSPYASYAAASICAAVAKFLVLYIGIVRIAVPVFLHLPEPQAAVISGMFSVPQLATALIGGFLALLLLPGLKKSLGRSVN